MNLKKFCKLSKVTKDANAIEALLIYLQAHRNDNQSKANKELVSGLDRSVQAMVRAISVDLNVIYKLEFQTIESLLGRSHSARK
jgi:predicted component of type VI protein secretion system